MSANNSQKTHLVKSLSGFAAKKAADAIAVLGKALPASVVSVDGSIVTVRFEIQSGFTLPDVTCPLAGAEYVRYPIQPGCPGVVFPADARLGGVTGLGGGTATLVRPANLAALTFFPLGNADWADSGDPDALVLYGEAGGVVVRTKDGSVYLKVTNNGIEMRGNVTIIGKLSTSDEADLAGGAKPVVLDGDSVVAGKVVASSTKTRAT